MSKKTEVVKNVLIWIIAIVVINAFLFVIQTVDFYTGKTNDGEKIVIGFDRGFGGVFSSWKFNIDSNNNLTVNKKDTQMLSGYLATSEYVRQTKESLQQSSVPVVKSDNRKKLDYAIYNDSGVYYYLATCESPESMGIVAWSTSQISDEEAIDLFERIQATKGVGYYVSCVCSEALDMIGD